MNAIKVWSLVSAVVLASQTVLVASVSPAVAVECYEKRPLRPIYRSYVRRDIEQPGVYDITRSPSTYGVYQRKVVEPSETIWHESPPVYRTVTKRVRVGGGWTWTNKCVEGKEVKCRVRVPARYETVEKKVLVRSGQRYIKPPKVSYVQERILLKPYRNYAHYQPPHVRYRRDRLKIYPEGYQWAPTSYKSGC